MDLTQLRDQYKSNLLEDVVPFWIKNSIDTEYGGFYSCLDEHGEVYDTDKFIWLQARQTWVFAMLYNQVEQRKEWLDLAIHGAEFLKKHGRDEEGNWYFSLTRTGKPLVQPYNIFSDCFAAMAFGQLFKATDEPTYSNVAKQTFNNIIHRQANPKGKYSKAFPETRPLMGFALPMILSNLVLEVEHLLPSELVNETIDNALDTIFNKFYYKESGLILENVTTSGMFSDSFEGRLVNPGHTLEAMWFIMDLADRQNKPDLINKAVEIAFNALEFGWDELYGGLYYFKDIHGHPPQQLEWDQKLWWVHLEAIVCMLKGYAYTRNEKCLMWFKKLHEYTWTHFPDAEYGEWYAYLNRRGEVLLPLKGGKWKISFHVVRSLYQSWQTLSSLVERQNIDEKVTSSNR